MTLVHWLLVLMGGASLLPEALAATFSHSERAWEYVLYGAETTALILMVGHLLAPRLTVDEARYAYLALAYGAFEAAQRPACRLAFPMDRAPSLPNGQYLCDAAGLSTSQLSVLLVMAVAFMLAMRMGHGSAT
jgi:hypothetical protein